PAGLAIVDTRDWSIQRLDPGADTVTVADGVLLATGRRLAPGQDTPTGMGLAAYGADRSLRFRLFQGSSSWVLRALDGRAYDEKGGLRFANVAWRRLVKRTVRLAGGGRALLWARPDRVVAIVDKCCAGVSELVVVDPGSRRVLSRQELPGEVSALARGSSS